MLWSTLSDKLCNEIKLCTSLICIISLRDDGHYTWRHIDWHHKVCHVLLGVAALAAWQFARWHILWCTLSICMLSLVSGSEGRLYQAWWDLQRGMVASFMIYAVSVCGKVTGGFITSQVSIVNRFLGPFIEDLLQFPVWNDCLLEFIASKYCYVS